MRSVVWRRGQTIGSTANGNGRVRSANPAGTQAAAFRHARNVRMDTLPTAPLESQLPYRYGVEMEEWFWLSYDPGFPGFHLFEERILTTWNDVH
jgi:hypothetical protein